MLRIGAVHLVAGHVEVRQDAQRDQCGDALPVGRDLVQGVAPVVLRHGLDPFGLEVGQVFGGDAAAVVLGKLFNGMGDFAAIEGLPLGGSNGPQTPRGVLELEQLAHLRRTAPGQKAVRKAGLRLQLGRGRGPLLLHHHRNQITALGHLDGGLQQICKGQFAKAVTQRHPTCHGTRHGDRVKTTLRGCFSLGTVLAVKVIGRPGRGGRAGGVEAVQLLAIPQNRKRVRPQTATDRLGQGDDSSGGDGSVDCIAPLEHHPQTRLRGQRVRGGDHIARKQRQTGAGVGKLVIEIHVNPK